MQDPELDNLINPHEVIFTYFSHVFVIFVSVFLDVFFLSKYLSHFATLQVKHWMDPALIPYGWGLFSEGEEVSQIE